MGVGERLHTENNPWSGMGWSGIMEWNGVEWILVEYDYFKTCWPARPAIFSKIDFSGVGFQLKSF